MTEEKIVFVVDFPNIIDSFCVMDFPNMVDFLLRYKPLSDRSLFFSSSLTPAVLTMHKHPLTLFLLQHALDVSVTKVVLRLVGGSPEQSLQEWAVRQLQAHQQGSAWSQTLMWACF